MPPELEAEFYAETKRHLDAVVALIGRAPAFKRHFACGMLGKAIALADSVGADADGFIAHLRATQAVRVPPKDKQS
jgi:hypothetical protein